MAWHDAASGEAKVITGATRWRGATSGETCC
jgi:hypothetical protein